jgi:hypothetical protein
MGSNYDVEVTLPGHRPEVEKAFKIFEGAGCSETGPVTSGSEIDFAVK